MPKPTPRILTLPIHYRHQRQHADRQCYLTHGTVPVNNIIINRDYDRGQADCMLPGAQ